MENRQPPVIYIFSGLPASGKSTLAQRLATHTSSAYLRIDTIEQALREMFHIPVYDQGYRLAYRMAQENLNAKIDVVADSCNPVQVTRADWMSVAAEAHCRSVNIEVVCSDPQEHRTRAETRTSAIQGLRLPTWSEILQRDYEPWTQSRIIIDTAGTTPEQSFQELLHSLTQTPL